MLAWYGVTSVQPVEDTRGTSFHNTEGLETIMLLPYLDVEL